MGRLRHRGPDWSGLYQSGHSFLAHQRLAIVDPASGDQPLYNEDKQIVVTVSRPLYKQIVVTSYIQFAFILLLQMFGEFLYT